MAAQLWSAGWAAIGKAIPAALVQVPWPADANALAQQPWNPAVAKAALFAAAATLCLILWAVLDAEDT